MFNRLPPQELNTTEVYKIMAGILKDYAPEFRERMSSFATLIPIILTDLDAYVNKDPAAHRSARMVFHEYRCYRAILYYRLAHALLETEAEVPTQWELLESTARRLSEAAKVLSGVEIHPRAQIGPGFIVDHGMGVVIGETTQIGHHVTILNGVVLGARKAAFNKEGKRHPTLGNHVELGGDVKIFGPVSIGDHCCIGARAIITKDLPAYSHVSVRTTLQIIKTKPTDLYHEDLQIPKAHSILN